MFLLFKKLGYVFTWQVCKQNMWLDASYHVCLFTWGKSWSDGKWVKKRNVHRRAALDEQVNSCDVLVHIVPHYRVKRRNWKYCLCCEHESLNSKWGTDFHVGVWLHHTKGHYWEFGCHVKLQEPHICKPATSVIWRN